MGQGLGAARVRKSTKNQGFQNIRCGMGLGQIIRFLHVNKAQVWLIKWARVRVRCGIGPRGKDGSSKSPKPRIETLEIGNHQKQKLPTLETLVANSDLGKINPKWKLLGLAFLLQVGNLKSSTLQFHPNLAFQACPFQFKLTFCSKSSNLHHFM